MELTFFQKESLNSLIPHILYRLKKAEKIQKNRKMAKKVEKATKGLFFEIRSLRRAEPESDLYRLALTSDGVRVASRLENQLQIRFTEILGVPRPFGDNQPEIAFLAQLGSGNNNFGLLNQGGAQDQANHQEGTQFLLLQEPQPKKLHMLQKEVSWNIEPSNHFQEDQSKQIQASNALKNQTEVKKVEKIEIQKLSKNAKKSQFELEFRKSKGGSRSSNPQKVFLKKGSSKNIKNQKFHK